MEGIEKICNHIDKPTDLCDWKINAQCAEHIVMDNKKAWSPWPGAALACGCPLNFEEEKTEWFELENKNWDEVIGVLGLFAVTVMLDIIFG